MEPYERVSLHLPHALAKWIKEEALKEKRSVNNYIIILLEDVKNNNGKEKVPCTLPQ